MQRLHTNYTNILPSTHLCTTVESASYKSALLSAATCSPKPKLTHHGFPKKPKDLQNRCFHYLSYTHFIASCRDPVICWFCRTSGHLKRNCPFASQFVKQTKVQKTPVPTIEPAILDHPTSLDVHYPPSHDLNSLVMVVSVEPAAPSIVPWFRRIFHGLMVNPRVCFTIGGVGHIFTVFLGPEDLERALWSSPLCVEGRVVSIFPHN